MKKYVLTCALLAAAVAVEARAARPSRARLQEQAGEARAEADSLRRLSGLQGAAIDSLQNLLDRMEARLENRARTARESSDKPADPEQAAADSIADLQFRLQRKQIESTFDTHGLTVLDTLDSGNDALHVILYANNTWKYVRNRAVAKDSTIFEKYWDTTSLFPYQEVDMSSMPQSVVIDLIDTTKSYHYPYKGAVNPRGKYGPRRGRPHQPVHLPLVPLPDHPLARVLRRHPPHIHRVRLPGENHPIPLHSQGSRHPGEIFPHPLRRIPLGCGKIHGGQPSLAHPAQPGRKPIYHNPCLLQCLKGEKRHPSMLPRDKLPGLLCVFPLNHLYPPPIPAGRRHRSRSRSVPAPQNAFSIIST